jgi:MOSC domain-containing protein YiiM
MKLLSVNVAQPRTLRLRERTTRSAIGKQPVMGAVMLNPLNLEGDRQADLRVHGGPLQAVYVYPSEHYQYWKAELPNQDLPYGVFGENFTTEGLLETEVRVGDQFRVGEAIVAVTKPRTPCFKLEMTLGQPGFIKRFYASERSGFYLAVVQPGIVEAGNTIELIQRDPAARTIWQVQKQ